MHVEWGVQLLLQRAALDLHVRQLPARLVQLQPQLGRVPDHGRQVVLLLPVKTSSSRLWVTKLFPSPFWVVSLSYCLESVTDIVLISLLVLPFLISLDYLIDVRTLRLHIRYYLSRLISILRRRTSSRRRA